MPAEMPPRERVSTALDHQEPDLVPIDIGGTEGAPIFASDHGVVVFAGWSNYGYGYMIVLDHGNTWQTAYAHLSGVGVICGQSVYQGDVIGALGSTGNSSGNWGMSTFSPFPFTPSLALPSTPTWSSTRKKLPRPILFLYAHRSIPVAFQQGSP